MEVCCGVVSRQSPICFSSSLSSSASCSKELNGSAASVSMGRRRKVGGGAEVMMSDQSHLQYYGVNSSRVVSAAKSSEKMLAGKGLKKVKKEKKQQLKLLKGLSRDLSAFSQIGFGLDINGDLADQVQGNMISEATDVLLKQLEKLKAEEKEIKRKKKEEKAHAKALLMQNRPIGCEMSSSSSSESSSSSDSECGEVVNMKSLKRAQMSKTATQSVVEVEAVSPPTTPVIPVLPSSEPVAFKTVQVAVLATAPVSDEKVAMESSCVRVCQNSMEASTSSKKIEVCMGGKCKKSGAGELLDKFREAIGIEGAVSGCKCMGKCRNAPNVKVVNGDLADSSVRSPSNNALCIGVGLEDVDTIVANFLGENQNQVQFAA